MKRAFRGAIFDMDGTLIDSLIFWEEYWKYLSRAYLDGTHFRPTKEDDKLFRTTLFPDVIRILHEQYGIAGDYDTLLQDSFRFLKEFYESAVMAKPGAQAFLSACREAGIPMCIATATDPSLVRAALVKCELDEYFSHIITCAEVGYGKDRPDVFLAAAALLGTPKAETWVFEDSATAILTAASAGFPTVAVFDEYNYGQDILRKTADVYVSKGETLEKLLPLSPAL